MKNQPTKFESNQTNAQGEPLFNSGLAYLERMHKLAEWYHQAMMMQNYEMALQALSGLLSEASPRLTQEEYESLNNLRSIAMGMFSTIHSARPGSKLAISPHMLQGAMNRLFEGTNRALHAHGLVMPNKDDVTSALKV